MRKIIYYVASSIDGYISGPNDDINGFVNDGKGVERYLEDLTRFDTVIMGRNTYEFGYPYGLVPGQPAYPHMKHYIFSNNLTIENLHPQVEIKKIDLTEIDNIQKQDGSDIYLCGGGVFAGWLLDNQKIDLLRIKLNPLIMGTGVSLFGSSTRKYSLELIDSEPYEKGLQIMTYAINYHNLNG